VNCASCGLPRPDAKHIIDLPDMLLPKGHCGAALHPAWADECANREVSSLRSQLSAATARASELETENARLDANAFEANSRRLQIEAESFRLASLTIDALTSPPCECKGTGATVGAGGFSLCPRCEAERFSRDLVAKRDAELSALGERVARLEAAARVVVAADTYVTPGKSRFGATTEAIGKLEALLPELPAMCAAAGLLQPETKGKTDERHDD
jgi:hypothetical protein